MMQIVDLTQKRKIRHELVVESRTSTDCTAVMLSIILEIDDPRRLADPPTAESARVQSVATLTRTWIIIPGKDGCSDCSVAAKNSPDTRGRILRIPVDDDLAS
jgi:hypothetical protein